MKFVVCKEGPERRGNLDNAQELTNLGSLLMGHLLPPKAGPVNPVVFQGENLNPLDSTLFRDGVLTTHGQCLQQQHTKTFFSLF